MAGKKEPAAAAPPIDTPAAPEIPPKRIAGPVWAGIVVIALFFGGFTGWAALAPLDSAAIATGTVGIETSRKTVQHLEGGIVDQILVREGDTVAQGQVLIRLDQTQVRARIKLLHGQVSALDRQLALLRDEIGSMRVMVKKKLALRSRLLTLMRQQASVEGERSKALAQLLTAEDALKRSEIKAPLAGTVVGLQVHTVGGVINRGEPLLYIVPSAEGLVIEARIDPLDIDVVRAGMLARVRLTPYNQRNSLPIRARVVSVSADSMTDERSGVSYYLARIELLEDPAKVMAGAALYPGMPVEVMIVTGERTALDYFLQPITRSLNRAFREE